MTKLTQTERERILALHSDGLGRNAIAREVNRSPGIVSKVVTDAGLGFDRSATKKATEVRVAYAESRRLEIIGKGFDKADLLLSGIQDAGEFQKWTVGFGTLVDKARLETGEATSRTENVDPSRRQRIKDSLDEVARKRRERVG